MADVSDIFNKAPIARNGLIKDLSGGAGLALSLADLYKDYASQQMQQQAYNYMYPQEFKVNAQLFSPLYIDPSADYAPGVQEALALRDRYSQDNIFVDNKGNASKFVRNPETGEVYTMPVKQAPKEIPPEVFNQIPKAGMGGRSPNSELPRQDVSPQQVNYMKNMQEIRQRDANLIAQEVAAFGGKYDPQSGMVSLPANVLTRDLLTSMVQKRQSDLGDIYRGAMQLPQGQRIVQQTPPPQPRAASAAALRNPYDREVADAQARVKDLERTLNDYKITGKPKRQAQSLYPDALQKYNDAVKKRQEWNEKRGPKSEGSPIFQEDGMTPVGQQSPRQQGIQDIAPQVNAELNQYKAKMNPQAAAKLDAAIKDFMKKNNASRTAAELHMLNYIKSKMGK